MSHDCHDCRYELKEPNPYCRCLLTYGEGITIEKIKDGLIGRCKDWKPVEKQQNDHP
jgi:hypothetical protein